MNLVVAIGVLALTSFIFYGHASESAFERWFEPNLRQFHQAAPRWYRLGSWTRYRRRMRFWNAVGSGVMSLLMLVVICASVVDALD